MAEFEDGTRVRYVGTPGLHDKWKGRVGVVKDTYRATEEIFLEVQFEGEEGTVSFYPEDFEAVKETYEIEMSAEDSTYAVMELTDAEASVLIRLVAAFSLDHNPERLQPTMTIKKKEKP
jgi:hypothetical protein